jgi:hypothetical protein
LHQVLVLVVACMCMTYLLLCKILVGFELQSPKGFFVNNSHDFLLVSSIPKLSGGLGWMQLLQARWLIADSL